MLLASPLQVWQLGSRTPNFTLEGHEKGVNCVDYYSGGDKPYLISGADDRLVKIWDYQVPVPPPHVNPPVVHHMNKHQFLRYFFMLSNNIYI